MRIFSYIFFSFFLMMHSCMSNAGSKVGYVQMKVIMQSQQSMDVGKRLMAEFKPRNAELEKSRKQLQEKEAALEKDAASLSQKDYSSKLREIQYLKIDFERKKNRQHEDFLMRKQEELNNFQESINNAVNTLGQNEGYDIILYNTGGYISQKVDVTDKVLKLIK